MIDRSGDRMIVALASYLDEDVSGAERFVALSTPAAKEALAPLGGGSDRLSPMPLFLGMPRGRPGQPEDLAREVVYGLRDGLAGSVSLGPLQAITTGHAAGLMAVEAACELIESGGAELCLAGGVDSYLEPLTLEWLEDEQQLHSRSNRFGFVPGEAAAFCLLASRSAARRYDLKDVARVLAGATAMERNPMKTETVCVGEGLTEAFSEVLAQVGGQVDYVLCDLNGERYRADEYGFTMTRLSGHFADPANFMAPASSWGDVGAASGPLFVAFAALSGALGTLPGPRVLAWTSAESGERSALLLEVEKLES
jgi:3-oxoacyl-[acyl-carrier-protein] synthase-1